MKRNKHVQLPSSADREDPVAMLTEGLSSLDEKSRSQPEKDHAPSRYVTGALVVMLLSVLAAFLLLLVILCLPANRMTTGEAVDSGESESTEPSASIPSSGLLTETGKNTVQIYAQCAPSVVSVEVKRASGTGIGSGFVLSENGYLATAYHVVEGAEEVTVYRNDGRPYRAALVAGDELTDLAVLKIEAEGLSPLDFGSSSQLKPGERVVAIGTPLSLTYAGSVDTGEISHHQRTVAVYDNGGTLIKKMKLLQTNVNLNPGNSGCPLLNEAGEVVGIVTMRLGESADGMAFAIPSDGAGVILKAMQNGEDVTDQTRSAVAVRAPKLGVVGERAEVDGSFGVRILRFASGDYDAMTKLKIDDVILSLGGKTVTSAEELASAIALYAPSDTVEVTVLRAGQRLTFSVILRS